MPLDIRITRTIDDQRYGAVTVHLAGSLDTATAPELQRQLDPILDSKVSDLVFDLGKLTFISSAGLRVFFVARKRLATRGAEPGFVNLQPQIKEVFDIVKALPGVKLFGSVEEMDAYLAARQSRHLQGGSGEPTPPSYNIDL